MNEGFIGIFTWLGLTESLEQIVQQGCGELARIPARPVNDVSASRPTRSRFVA